MLKKSFKQKCLAWILSLAIAITFIPMTAGFAFADDPVDDPSAEPVVTQDEPSPTKDDPTEVSIVLDLSKVSAKGTGTYTVGETTKEFYINLSGVWYDGVNKENLSKIGANGENQIAVLDRIKAPGVGNPVTTDAFTVSYPDGEDWTEPGKYKIVITAKPEVPIKTVEEEGTITNYYLGGTWTKECEIVDALNMEGTKVTLEYDKVLYDGQMHKPEVLKVENALGETVPAECYDVDYPSESRNAYIKTGTFDVEVTAKDGNEAGYFGSKTVTFNIIDEVKKVAVYSKAGLYGDLVHESTFTKTMLNRLSNEFTNTFDYGYKGNVWTAEKYVPIEMLLSESDLGEIGQFNDKDGLELWSNAEPELYTLQGPAAVAPYDRGDYNFAKLKNYKYTAEGGDNPALIIDKFGGDFTIPAFLDLNTIDPWNSPMMCVGYTAPGTSPAGNLFAKPVSRVVLCSMDIAGLESAADDVTYTGEAVNPEVGVYDGTAEVPVTVTEATAVEVGPAEATVEAAEDSAYYGTATVEYNIVPKGTELKSVAKGKKKFTAKWTKQDEQTTGYQIRYSLKSSFKSAKTKTIANNASTKATVKGLKAKKKYYVQIRTYKTVGKTDYYSAWSKTKTVKTK